MKISPFHISRYMHLHNSTLYVNGEELQQDHSLNNRDFVLKSFKETGSNYPKFYKMDALSKATFLAAHHLLEGREEEIRRAGDQTAILLSNAASSLDTDLKHLADIEDKSNYYPSPSVFVYTLPNIGLGEICIRYGIKGENCFYVFENFPADFLAKQSEDLMQNNLVQFVIGGWCEVFEDEMDIFLFLAENSNKGLPLDFDTLNNLYSKHKK